MKQLKVRFANLNTSNHDVDKLPIDEKQALLRTIVATGVSLPVKRKIMVSEGTGTLIGSMTHREIKNPPLLAR